MRLIKLIMYILLAKILAANVVIYILEYQKIEYVRKEVTSITIIAMIIIFSILFKFNKLTGIDNSKCFVCNKNISKGDKYCKNCGVNLDKKEVGDKDEL